MALDLAEKRGRTGGEDNVRQYLNEIRQYPRLTPEEERELAMGCAQGDEEAIRRMVNSNLRLVVSVAREYGGRGVPLLDLVQEGSIGLLIAAKRFDYTKDVRFSTYATKWIHQGISKCLASHGLIRVPSHTAERIRKLQLAAAELNQKNGAPPSEAELAQASGLPEDKVARLLALNPEVLSLDASLGEDEGTLAHYVEDAEVPQPYETLVREELRQSLQALLSTLEPRQQRVLRLRYGLENGKCLPYAEIGKMLGISKERARQIEKQATRKLQIRGAAIGLEDFLK